MSCHMLDRGRNDLNQEQGIQNQGENSEKGEKILMRAFII